MVRTGVGAERAGPGMAVAAAFAPSRAPSRAESRAESVTISGLVARCKPPGRLHGSPRGRPPGTSYAIVLSVTNPSTSQTLTIDEIDLAVPGSPAGTATYCPDTFLVPPGDSQIDLNVSDLGRQEQTTVTLRYHSNEGLESFSFGIDTYHPFLDGSPASLDPDSACA